MQACLKLASTPDSIRKLYMIAIKRASVHRQFHACSYSQRLIEPSRLIGSFPHTQNEESNNEGEDCETIEDGDNEIMVWE